MQTISKIENGQVTVKLEDGTEINVKQADLSVDDGVRIEAIAKLDGISATDANFIFSVFSFSCDQFLRFAQWTQETELSIQQYTNVLLCKAKLDLFGVFHINCKN